MLRRSLTSAAVLAVVTFGGPPAPAGARPPAPAAQAAKACSAGYTHAVIGGSQKCLRRGEFCAHRYNAQYHRYGYSCTHTDDRGNYHLT